MEAGQIWAEEWHYDTGSSETGGSIGRASDSDPKDEEGSNPARRPERTRTICESFSRVQMLC